LGGFLIKIGIHKPYQADNRSSLNVPLDPNAILFTDVNPCTVKSELAKRLVLVSRIGLINTNLSKDRSVTK